MPFPSRPLYANQPRSDSARIASAERQYRRYLALARKAPANGDTVEMENLYQHAEHYFRGDVGGRHAGTNDPGQAIPLGWNEG